MRTWTALLGLFIVGCTSLNEAPLEAPSCPEVAKAEPETNAAVEAEREAEAEPPQEYRSLNERIATEYDYTIPELESFEVELMSEHPPVVQELERRASLELLEDQDEHGESTPRIRVVAEGLGEASPRTLEAPVEIDACLTFQIGLDIIHSDGEAFVVDAIVSCQMGATVFRLYEHHTVFAFEAAGLRLLYSGEGQYINSRGYRVDKDMLEFYVEASDLAVYRHTVSWCDARTMQEILGSEAGRCSKTKRRGLELVERIPIRPH